MRNTLQQKAKEALLEIVDKDIHDWWVMVDRAEELILHPHSHVLTDWVVVLNEAAHLSPLCLQAFTKTIVSASCDDLHLQMQIEQALACEPGMKIPASDAWQELRRQYFIGSAD